MISSMPADATTGMTAKGTMMIAARVVCTLAHTPIHSSAKHDCLLALELGRLQFEESGVSRACLVGKKKKKLPLHGTSDIWTYIYIHL